LHCFDATGNAGLIKERFVEVFQAARSWRIVPIGDVGTVPTSWEVKGIEFFSDAFCTKGVPVVPSRAGWRQPNGVAFSSPLGTTLRADGAFAVWKRLGDRAQDEGPGWAAGQPCQAAAASPCHVGFAFTESVTVNCVRLRQGTGPGSWAAGLRLQWRRDGQDDGTVQGGWDGFHDLLVVDGLAGGVVMMQRRCPIGCGGCNSPNPTLACAPYSPQYRTDL